MKVLLDTQSWLWMLAAPERLKRASRRVVEADDSELLLSSASAWEIAIKFALGKLALPAPPEFLVPALMIQTRVTALPISHAHALRVATLPPHHRDPFDRILIAQAQIESIPVMTADPHFKRYDVEVIAA